MKKNTFFGRFWILFTLLTLSVSTFGQTVVKPPKNKYPPTKDIELGRQYSVQAEQIFPVLNDGESTRYAGDIGRRLVASIPPEYTFREFNYQFKILNCTDINAFAIAGGYLYLCRGMIENAKNEGEMVGVMAHEISHAALRHTTAQATKQSSFGTQLGTIGMILGGAILGGEAGAQLGMMGAMAWITKYSRDYEKQADLVGARIMATAGYDPHDLANMFKTIELERKGNAPPQWLSTHPDPGNRYNYINAEADKLRIASNPIRDTNEFQRQKRRMREITPAGKKMEQYEKEAEGKQQSSQSPTANGKYSNNVALPSSTTRQYNAGNVVSASVPNNWREFPVQSASEVWFAPDGAYGDKGISHGAIVGVTKGQGGNLQQETEVFVSALAKSNYYTQQGSYTRGSISGKNALRAVISGPSTVNSKNEIVTVYTAQLRTGELFYVLTVVPETEANSYSRAFSNIVSSIRINER
jgi:beta-barrel assembly-enhancing protease